MGRPTKVIIVDDQSLCREGLRELMKHWPEFSVVGEAANSTAQIDTDAFVENGVDYTDVFTPRETEVLKLVAAGLSNAEIGAQLYLGSGTVKKHLSCIMQKTGLENRVQVATFAYKAGFMDQ